MKGRVDRCVSRCQKVLGLPRGVIQGHRGNLSRFVDAKQRKSTFCRWENGQAQEGTQARGPKTSVFIGFCQHGGDQS
jgi:hypothetical protein